MNTEKVKVGLLGLISLTLIVNTYFVAVNADSNDVPAANPDTDWSGSVSNIDNNAGNNQEFTSGQQLNSQQGTHNPTANAIQNQPNPAAANAPVTNIKFENTEKHFGTVKAQSENLYAFEFVNTGTEPLLIENAKGSCGCTVPTWPKDPIMPGDKGTIDVKFTPKPRQAAGLDEKKVTITANTNPKNTVLTVKAQVTP